MKLVSIKPSTKIDKKYMATFSNTPRGEKTIHFGSKGMDDYTKTGDKEQRARYRARHSKNENWNKVDSAGALSRHVLWGDSTSMRENIKTFKQRFNL